MNTMAARRITAIASIVTGAPNPNRAKSARIPAIPANILSVVRFMSPSFWLEAVILAWRRRESAACLLGGRVCDGTQRDFEAGNTRPA